MKSLIGKLLIIASLSTLGMADEFIGTYYARLGYADHYNSRGMRLYSVAAIIRQDRFNFHIRHIRDPEDTYDPYFDSKENRATMERMLRRGYISRSARRAIIDGNPIIKVDIYRRHLNIHLVREDEPISVIR